VLVSSIPGPFIQTLIFLTNLKSPKPAGS
jgi:hypothetical protein